MSKTQEKRQARKEAAADFVAQRRAIQYQYMKSNFEVGKRVFEAKKETMTEGEVSFIEGEIVKNEALLEQLKEQAGSYAVTADEVLEATDSEVDAPVLVDSQPVDDSISN